MFTWIPIHQEAAQRLLQAQTDQSSLLGVLREMEDHGLKVISLKDRNQQGEVPLSEIDPFTFFATFNRGLKDQNRRANWQFLKDAWSLTAVAPTDFTGIPVVHPMSAWFFPYAVNRQPDHMSLLWELAREASGRKADRVEARLFNKCLELDRVSIRNLTIGLFWLFPNAFLPTDKKTVGYAADNGVTVDPVDHESYLRWLREVTEALGAEYPEISHDAHVWATGDETSGEEEEKDGKRRVWVYAPGNNASEWDDHYREGIMAIGWADLGDLTAYPDRESIRLKLVELRPEHNSAKTNNALACWQFANEIKPGDIVLAKQGLSKLVGYGVVAGPYEFRKKRGALPQVRQVQWKLNGEWDLPMGRKLPMKTLTDFTHYKQEVNELFSLMGIHSPPSGGNSAQPLVPPALSEPYSVANAVRDVFIPEAEFTAVVAAFREKKNIVLQGPPGVGKTFVAKRLAYALMGEKDSSRVETIQFHQSYAYEDFMQGLKPTADGRFELRNGVFYRFCERARKQEAAGAPFVFIIDEINRGNLSKIFGELMMMVESDKRGAEHSVRLTYGSETDRPFYVPSNVYVLGTMNTADRSLALVDYALRRRFRFVSLRPAFHLASFQDHLLQRGAAKMLIDKIVGRMNQLNEVIAGDRKNLGEGYQVGHSYFCPNGDVTLDDDWYRRVVELEVVPLLAEYWFDDEERVAKQRAALLA